MAIDKSTNYSLNKPTQGTRSWHTYLNENADVIDTEMKRLKDKDASQDLRIDNIVNETSGDKDLEVTDARLGSDGVARATLGELTREIHSELLESNQQTATLTHGLNLIQSDQASPLKVEFEGNTLVNLLGKDGNFEENVGGWTGVTSGTSNTYVVSSESFKFGSSSLKLTAPSANAQYQRILPTVSGKYYLFTGYFRTPQVQGRFNFNIGGSWSYGANTITGDHYNYVTFKFLGTGNDSVRANCDGVMYLDGLMLLEIPSEIYNAIGVTLTDADIQRLFPYCDSIQSVKNLVLSVEGANLLPPFTEWTLHANAKVVSPYELELNATAYNQGSYFLLDVMKNTDYYLSFTVDGMKFAIYNADASSSIKSYDHLPFTFNSGNNDKVRVYVSNPSQASGKLIATQPMLNLGSTSLPFVERNPSHLYAECVLAGIGDKKDILFQDFSDNGVWKVKREFGFEDDFGSLNWTYVSTHTGFKKVRLVDAFPNGATSISAGTEIVTKYDGTPLISTSSNEDLSIAGDRTWFGQITGGSASDLYITISDEDATGYDLTTTAGIQAYFTDKNYFLLYQLASPVTEVVQVEGDLSFTGDSQVSVGSGVIVREKVEPFLLSSTYRINQIVTTNDSSLSNRVKRIIKIYKNFDDDTHNWQFISDQYAYGDQRAYITESLFDTTATYTVTYEILDKYDFTCNLNEVKAYFVNSLKSSFSRVVEKQSDIATDVSVHKNAIINIYARLKVLEENQTV